MEMKMKITLITAICFAFGSAGMAQPKPPKANKPPTPNKPGVAKPGSERPSGPTIVKKPSRAVHLLQALDGNEDGKLSFQEIEMALEVLKQIGDKKLDKNKDGFLTVKEFSPVVQDSPARNSRASDLAAGLKGGSSPGRPSGVKRPNTRPQIAKRPGSGQAANNRTATAKRPGSRATRPGGRATRPTGRNAARTVKKSGSRAGALTSDLKGGSSPSGAASNRAQTTKRVARTNTGRRAKASVRRKPGTRSNVKPSANAGAQVVASTSPQDEAINKLIKDTKEITDKLSQAVANIQDANKKKAAEKWVSRDSKTQLRALEKSLNSNATSSKDRVIKKAQKRLDDLKKIIQ